MSARSRALFRPVFGADPPRSTPRLCCGQARWKGLRKRPAVFAIAWREKSQWTKSSPRKHAGKTQVGVVLGALLRSSHSQRSRAALYLSGSEMIPMCSASKASHQAPHLGGLICPRLCNSRDDEAREQPRGRGVGKVHCCVRAGESPPIPIGKIDDNTRREPCGREKALPVSRSPIRSSAAIAT
jgi:hypothetical protein